MQCSWDSMFVWTHRAVDTSCRGHIGPWTHPVVDTLDREHSRSTTHRVVVTAVWTPSTEVAYPSNLSPPPLLADVAGGNKYNQRFYNVK